MVREAWNKLVKSGQKSKRTVDTPRDTAPYEVEPVTATERTMRKIQEHLNGSKINDT